MNKAKAYADAKRAYPSHTPTRACGFMTTSDGCGVIIPGCHEARAAICIYHPVDLARLMSMCNIALDFQDRKKRRKKSGK